MSMIENYVSKLGHPLASVRSRALQNMMTKIDHHLITFAELSENETLIHHLMEWFNREECPQSKTVLTLLEQLSKIANSARIMNERGAILFFRTMRSFAPELLLSHIDNIVMNLENVPYELENCHKVEFVDRTVMIQSPKRTERANEKHSLKDSSNNEKTNLSPINNTQLSQQDLQYLFELNIKLRHRNEIVIREAIQELMHVVLNDFPPDVFFTSTDILKSLISLLFIGNHSPRILKCSLRSIAQIFLKSWLVVCSNKSQASVLIPICDQQKLSFVIRHSFTHILPLILNENVSSIAVETLRAIVPFLHYSAQDLSDIRLIGEENTTIFSLLLQYLRSNLSKLIVEVKWLNVLHLTIDCIESIDNSMKLYVPKELISIFYDLLLNYKLKDNFSSLYIRMLDQMKQWDPSRAKNIEEDKIEINDRISLQHPILIRELILNKIEELSECINEKTFLDIMDTLEELDFSNQDVIQHLGSDWKKAFHRFLVTPPRTETDCVILLKTLDFLRRVIGFLNTSQILYFAGIIESNILPLLSDQREFKIPLPLQLSIILIVESMLKWSFNRRSDKEQIILNSREVFNTISLILRKSDDVIIKSGSIRIITRFLTDDDSGLYNNKEDIASEIIVYLVGIIDKQRVPLSFRNRHVINESLVSLCAYSANMYSKGISWIGLLSFSWIQSLFEDSWISSVPKSAGLFLLSKSIPNNDDFQLLQERIPNILEMCVLYSIDKSGDPTVRENSLSLLSSVARLLSENKDLVELMDSTEAPTLVQLIDRDKLSQLLSCVTEPYISPRFVSCLSCIVFNFSSSGPEACSILFEFSVWQGLIEYINNNISKSTLTDVDAQHHVIECLANICDSILCLLTVEPSLANYFVERTEIIPTICNILTDQKERIDIHSSSIDMKKSCILLLNNILYHSCSLNETKTPYVNDQRLLQKLVETVYVTLNDDNSSSLHHLVLKLLVSILNGPKEVWSSILDRPHDMIMYGTELCNRMASFYQLLCRSTVSLSQDKSIVKKILTLCASWAALLSVSEASKSSYIDHDYAPLLLTQLDVTTKLFTLKDEKTCDSSFNMHLTLLQPHIRILQAFVHESESAKDYLSKFQVFNVLHRIWKAPRVSEVLRQDIMSLIMNLLSHSHSMKKNITGYYNSRTRNNIVQTTLQLMTESKTNIKTLFLASRILSSMTTYPSTCSIVLKSDLLNNFKKNLGTLWHSKSLYRLDIVLFVIVSISFTAEGQIAILRTKGLTETILSLSDVLQLESGKEESQWDGQELQVCKHWLTIVRNLSFQKASNAVNIISEELVGNLISVLKSKRYSRETKCFSALVLHAGMYNSPKCRHLLAKPVIRDILYQHLVDVDINQ